MDHLITGCVLFVNETFDNICYAWLSSISPISDTDTSVRALIIDGMAEYEKLTCLKFRKKQSTDVDYLKFINDDGYGEALPTLLFEL